jgi:lipopolysaccharide biosynthesis regulator YciM
MDFDLQWLLFALPVAFALGWIASRIDLRQMRRVHRDSPRAYFKGLNLLLNEQQDKAIDAFIEAVQNDPDTAELHFALGNLFRRRGEFERAVRVHEHLLARADLKPAERHRAQHALAQDFMHAGLFDRAEAAWRKLEGTAFERDALLALLALAERSRDWPRAVETATRLEREMPGSFAVRIAHYRCEIALQADERGDTAAADAALAQASAAAPDSARVLVLQGQRLARAGRHAEALQAWDRLSAAQPASFALVATPYCDSARACGQASAARTTLERLYAAHPGTALLAALRALEGGDAQPLVQHLQRVPTLSAAQALLAEPPQAWGDAGLAALRKAVDRAADPVQRYRCAACGFEARHWFWQCPGCLGWDTFPPRPIEEL